MFKCHEVVEIIMECFARGLGLKEDFFRDVSCCCTADKYKRHVMFRQNFVEAFVP